MKETRFSETASDVFETAFKMTDVKQACLMIATLCGNVIEEQKLHTRYSSQTGEPIEHKWVPYGEELN